MIVFLSVSPDTPFLSRNPPNHVGCQVEIRQIKILQMSWCHEDISSDLLLKCSEMISVVSNASYDISYLLHKFCIKVYKSNYPYLPKANSRTREGTCPRTPFALFQVPTPSQAISHLAWSGRNIFLHFPLFSSTTS